MYKELLVVLLLTASLSQLALADDPVDDEIKVAAETQTANPTTEQPAVTTSAALQSASTKPTYMCLIYCVCGCLEHHCCSGCKRCSQDELKDIFLSNMNTNENAAMGAETTVSP